MNDGPWISSQLGKPRHRTLTKQQETELFKTLRVGDEKAKAKARAAIVNANMRFLVSVAGLYVNRGVPLEDLIAEGALGLMEAVNRFDYSTGNKFISYAVWWIRQTLLMALGKTGRVIKLPPHRIGIYFKIGKARDRLYQKLEREPDVAELAAAAGLTEADVMESVRYCAPEMSLDFEDEEGKTSPLESAGPLPDRTYKEIKDARYQDSLLKDLQPFDREIIERTYGLKDGVQQTLEEIGDLNGLTRERIRQRRNKAIGLIQRKAKFLDSKETMERLVRRNLVTPKESLSIGEGSK